jgi:hypothetical protein
MAVTSLSMNKEAKDKAEFDRSKWRGEQEALLRRIMSYL